MAPVVSCPGTGTKGLLSTDGASGASGTGEDGVARVRARRGLLPESVSGLRRHSDPRWHSAEDNHGSTPSFLGSAPKRLLSISPLKISHPGNASGSPSLLPTVQSWVILGEALPPPGMARFRTAAMLAARRRASQQASFRNTGSNPQGGFATCCGTADPRHRRPQGGLARDVEHDPVDRALDKTASLHVHEDLAQSATRPSAAQFPRSADVPLVAAGLKREAPPFPFLATTGCHRQAGRGHRPTSRGRVSIHGALR
jgi:hypothetical protein